MVIENLCVKGSKCQSSKVTTVNKYTSLTAINYLISYAHRYLPIIVFFSTEIVDKYLSKYNVYSLTKHKNPLFAFATKY